MMTMPDAPLLVMHDYDHALIDLSYNTFYKNLTVDISTVNLAMPFFCGDWRRERTERF
jgi:hypothetical protein